MRHNLNKFATTCCGSAMIDDAQEPDADDEASTPAEVVKAEELFGEHRELVIEHNGERYRLRITRRNKLILQK